MILKTIMMLRFDMKKTFFEKDWGFLHGEISKYRFDFLPRVTVSQIPHMLEINIGFFCFRIWLTIYSDEMQEFNRTTRESKQ